MQVSFTVSSPDKLIALGKFLVTQGIEGAVASTEKAVKTKAADDDEAPVKRGRGRPPKVKLAEPDLDDEDTDTADADPADDDDEDVGTDESDDEGDDDTDDESDDEETDDSEEDEAPVKKRGRPPVSAAKKSPKGSGLTVEKDIIPLCLKLEKATSRSVVAKIIRGFGVKVVQQLPDAKLPALHKALSKALKA